MFNPCPVVQWLEVSDFQKSASTWGVWNPHRPKFPSGEARRLKRLAPVLTLVRRQLSGDVAVALPATFDVLHGYYGCDGTLRDTCGSRCIPALRSTMVHRYSSSIVNSCQPQSSNLLGCLFGYHHYLGRIPPISSQPSFSMSTPLRWTNSPTRARLFGAAAHAEASDLFPGRDIWVSIGSGIPGYLWPFNGETNVSRFWGSRKWDNPTWRARGSAWIVRLKTPADCQLGSTTSASRPCYVCSIRGCSCDDPVVQDELQRQGLQDRMHMDLGVGLGPEHPNMAKKDLGVPWWSRYPISIIPIYPHYISTSNIFHFSTPYLSIWVWINTYWYHF